MCVFLFVFCVLFLFFLKKFIIVTIIYLFIYHFNFFYKGRRQKRKIIVIIFVVHFKQNLYIYNLFYEYLKKEISTFITFFNEYLNFCNKFLLHKRCLYICKKKIYIYMCVCVCIYIYIFFFCKLFFVNCFLIISFFNKNFFIFLDSIITKADLLQYTAERKEPLTTMLADNLQIFTPPLPSSGALLIFMLNILDGNLSNSLAPW